MERTAVSISFWIGGAALVVVKVIAYVATGSLMVRTSLFDSIGDVFSGAILQGTQVAMNNTRDARRYPAGKHRFAPLGVLCFCAFMFSSMMTVAMESIQQLLQTEEAPVVMSTETSADVLKRMFTEHRRLRWASTLSGFPLDKLLEEYGGEGALQGAAAAEEEDGVSPVKLLGVCVAVKLVLYFYCKAVQRAKGSEMIKALAADHFNDMITNTIVICTMYVTELLQNYGFNSPYLAKLDPSISLALSLWILYGWVTQGLDQVKVLSDRRVDEDDLDVQSLQSQILSSLQGSNLNLRALDVYYAGDGFRIRLDLCPSAGAPEDKLAEALQKIRQAAANAESETPIVAVETCLRSRQEAGGEGGDWAKEYQGRMA
mmetsp:Transcript_51674/g.109787  ORF Transcript_51674/g.109787 Transcript_51674/m.109787 type:complete len:373 (-) Transcript_51674:150-1268(-)